MADTKISALPASATPLAGTEVLPIVQSSVTKQVSVANLTAGRAVATGALTVTGAATVSTTLGVTGVSTLTGGAVVQGLTVGLGAGALANNTAVGVSALAAVTSGNVNTAMGQGCLSGNTTGGSNSGFGQAALNANISGNYNTAVGAGALPSNTTASNNTAVGYQAGYTGTAFASGSITALGYKAAYAATAGRIVAIGEGALIGTTSGDANVAVGYYAGNSNISGTLNTYVGDFAAHGATGDGNTVVGARAGFTSLTSGANNVLIGYAAAVGAGTDAQSIAIGYNTTGKGSNTGFINPNTGGVYQGNNSTLWSVTSDQRIKKNIVNNNTGLSVINQIQVRNFEYRLPEEITELPQNQAVAKTGVQLGVIAQEFQQILPECVKTESTGVMSVDADNLTWYLINAVKELTARVAQLESKP